MSKPNPCLKSHTLGHNDNNILWHWLFKTSLKSPKMSLLPWRPVIWEWSPVIWAVQICDGLWYMGSVTGYVHYFNRLLISQTFACFHWPLNANPTDGWTHGQLVGFSTVKVTITMSHFYLASLPSPPLSISPGPPQPPPSSQTLRQLDPRFWFQCHSFLPITSNSALPHKTSWWTYISDIGLSSIDSAKDTTI